MTEETRTADRAPYHHRQIGWVAVIGLGGMVVTCAILGALAPATGWIAGAASAVAIALAAIFSTLEITVDRETVGLTFGPLPLVRRRWALRSFADGRRIRTSVLHGWGIHWIGRGWVYNASGFDAIELRRDVGGVTILGTDDPTGLVDALERAGVKIAPSDTGD